MSALVFEPQKDIADFIGKLVGKSFVEPFTAFGIIDDSGHLQGGFVFNSYTGESISMSLAGRVVAQRKIWRAVLFYVFQQLKCSRLEIRTSRANHHVRKLAPRLGFKFEGVARKLYGKHDGLCYSLTVDDVPEFSSRWKLE